MVLLQKGSRLSISPVTAGQWQRIVALAGIEEDGVLMDIGLVLILLAMGCFGGFAAGLLGIGGGMILVPFITMIFAPGFPARG
jgi:hypothetical protein